MKTKYTRQFAYTLIALGIALSARAVPALSDDFESGNLNQWEGKLGGVHNGIIVSDPLAGSHVNVLAFDAVKSGGDIFTKKHLLTGQYELSFDYLGVVPAANGFIGTVNWDESYGPKIWGAHWLAGVQGLGADISLANDNQWHHYNISIQYNNPFKLMLEDYSGNPRDALFDNIRLDHVPEAGQTALLLGIGCAILVVSRRFLQAARS